LRRNTNLFECVSRSSDANYIESMQAPTSSFGHSHRDDGVTKSSRLNDGRACECTSATAILLATVDVVVGRRGIVPGGRGFASMYCKHQYDQC
jgi:hypothetical protein